MLAIEGVRMKYPVVYDIIGSDPRTGKPEKKFYIV
jgi:hypothetical protein